MTPQQLRTQVQELSRQAVPLEAQRALIVQLWKTLDVILLNIEVVAGLDPDVDDRAIIDAIHSECVARAERLVRQLQAFSAQERPDS